MLIHAEHNAYVHAEGFLQADKIQEVAALLASQELIAEEEREQTRAAAKKLKKDVAKLKKQHLWELRLSEQQAESRKPPGELHRSVPLPEAATEPAELSASSPSKADSERSHWSAWIPGTPSSSALDANLHTGTEQDHDKWYCFGRQGIVSSVVTLTLPAKAVESAQMQPSAITAASSSASASFPRSCSPEEALTQLLLCPITQVMLVPMH